MMDVESHYECYLMLNTHEMLYFGSVLLEVLNNPRRQPSSAIVSMAPAKPDFSGRRK